MAIKDESRFSGLIRGGLIVPVQKVIFGKGFLLPESSKRGALKICRDENIAGMEEYRLDINQKGIEVHARTDAGSYYAQQTLRELTAIYPNGLPVCKIEDWPDFERRGVYLDCSRGKVPTLNTLKELATWLSHWKINEIQLYIENVFTFKRHQEIGRGYSPFTPDEILSFQKHCRRHHIRLVGSLASFGHLEKILALPGYRHLGEKPGFRGFAGGTTLCPIDPGSIKLIEELYSEFVPLFEAVDFNACCDETWELGKGKSRSKARLVGTGELYLDFLLRIHRLCEKHGRRMNVWADIILKHPQLLRKLPRDVVLLNWEYEQNGANIARTKEIADSSLSFMVCPGTSGWLTHGSRLTNSMGNITNFAAEGRKNNAEGMLNTDWGDNGHRNFLGVSLHGFAHGAAQAWNGKAVDNTRFTDSFCYHAFGQRNNNMAEAIRLLGNTYITCGGTLPNKSLLYGAFFEPVFNKGRSEIDMLIEAGLQQILAELSDDSVWPSSRQVGTGAPVKTMGNFEQLVLKELKLAARMDCLSARRALIVKRLRKSQGVKGSELRDLRREMQEVESSFEELWLSRNKISRLYDNLLLFHRAQEELERMAKGKN